MVAIVAIADGSVFADTTLKSLAVRADTLA